MEATRYAGLVYYEDLQDLVTFAAVKNLNALLEVSVQLLVILLNDNSASTHSLSRKTTLVPGEDRVFIFIWNHWLITLN